MIHSGVPEYLYDSPSCRTFRGERDSGEPLIGAEQSRFVALFSWPGY